MQRWITFSVKVNENIKAYGVDPIVIRRRSRISLDMPARRGADQLYSSSGSNEQGDFDYCLGCSLKKEVSYEEVKAAYDKYYDKEKFVRVLDKDVCPQTKWVEGSNFVDVNFKIMLPEQKGSL